MRRVEAKVDEERDWHSIFEPLYHIGLSIQRMGHIASQGDAFSCVCCHKLRLLSHAVDTWRKVCTDQMKASELTSYLVSFLKATHFLDNINFNLKSFVAPLQRLYRSYEPEWRGA